MIPEQTKLSFRRDLIDLINTYSIDNETETQDFLLADYIMDSIDSYDRLNHRKDMLISQTRSQTII